MFGKKAAKSSGGGARSKNNDLANLMGIGVPMDVDDDDDEDSLLAELAALEGKSPNKQKGKPKKKLVSMDEIKRMAAAGMKDIDEMEDDDDDIDENDLLAELNEIASDEEDLQEDDDTSSNKQRNESDKPSSNVKSILLARKEMYNVAITNAKAEGATSKVRRFDRGLKEIDNLIKKYDKGGSVQEEEIPPPVATKSSIPTNNTQTLPGPSPDKEVVAQIPVQPFTSITPDAIPTSQPTSTQPKESDPPGLSPALQGKVKLLQDRQKQFKVFALKLKQEGNMEDARKQLATAKQFDSVISAVQDGKDIDLSNMPNLPNEQQAHPKQETLTTSAASASSSADPSISNGPPAASASLPAPTTITEFLQQGLAKYQESAGKAKEDGNSSKQRRMGRIVKQYQDAIKANKLNKPFDYSELPVPPGFGPIPGVTASEPSGEVATSSTPPKPAPNAQLPPPKQESTAPITASRNEKEYEFLVKRQKEFKMAALEAKKSGDVESAREYLRQAKGMDKMITAAQNGLRVDITTVPSLKRKEKSLNASPNAIATEGTKIEFEPSGTKQQQFMEIEAALEKQIETAAKNTEHYKLLGNLDAAKNFEALLTSSQKDLVTLQYFKQNNGQVPKCNFLMKMFPVVRSNPHLSDSELEITVARCINVPMPQGYQAKDMYCYVTYEFPYPQDRPQTGQTTTKKETINPEYNESFKVVIDRKQSAFKRFCRRHAVNIKVFHVRGLLRSDKALGQANFKIASFSNRCEIHECVDLMDVEKGRKAVGGKIEVILKIREPFEDKDTEVVKEKWLVLDTHLRGLDLKTPSQSSKNAVASQYESLEVLKSEKTLFEKQITAYKSQGKTPPPALFEKIKSHQQKIEAIQTRLKQGGKQGFKDYLKNLSRGLEVEKAGAQKALQNDDKQTAKNCLTKRKLLEKEIGVIKQRLGI